MTAVPRPVRVRMLLRSFSIQGSWNYETLIGTGFAYTLLPALRFLHGKEGRELDTALQHHVDLFNSHPYFATVAVGAVSRLEVEGVDASVVRRFKAALRGSLGSIGDRLFWTTWRPMSVLIGLVLLLAGATWWVAATVFLVIYNTLHLTVRLLGLGLGSRAGLEVGSVLREVPLQPVIERSSQLACALAGLAAVLAASSAFPDPMAMGGTAAAIAMGFWLGLRTRRVMVALVAGVAGMALAFGLIGYGA